MTTLSQRFSGRSLVIAGIAAGAIAAIGNLLVLVIGQAVFGVDFVVPAQPGSTALMPLPAGLVVGASVVPALAATLLLWILTKLPFVSSPVRVFQIIGVLFLLVSFVPVLTIPVGTDVQIGLGLMHLVAGSAIIGVLSQSHPG